MRIGFTRTCPRCRRQWFDLQAWITDTTITGQETKYVEEITPNYGRIKSATITHTIKTIIRKHRGCGGEMIDQGEVIDSRPKDRQNVRP